MYISILRPVLKKKTISFSPYNRAKIDPKITPPPDSKVDGEIWDISMSKKFQILEIDRNFKNMTPPVITGGVGTHLLNFGKSSLKKS